MAEPIDSYEWLRLAASIQADVNVAGLVFSRSETDYGDVEARSLIQQFDEMVTSQGLKNASRQLFADGHYANAVENAFKCLNNAVKEKSGLSADGDGLMTQAFGARSPILKLNSLQSQSDQNEQKGYMQIFAGVMAGIRNPRAHEHEIVDDPEVALEMIIIANHLIRKLENSTLVGSDDNE